MMGTSTEAATDASRRAVWRALGAAPGEIDELLAYAAPRFDAARLEALPPLPLDDEPHVAIWREYVAEAARDGAEACLRRHLVQLRFPIDAETGDRDDYRAATRRGEWPAETDGGAPLQRGDAIVLFVHPTPVGGLPVIVAPARADFVTLMRALTCRNAPAPIPASLGACMVAGYNNWDRVHRARQAWEQDQHAGDAVHASWPEAFRALRAEPSRYQDRFILLSDGPYSAVAHGEMGLDAEEWLACSRTIRLEHECAHYFTKCVFGTMRNTLHDELIADYVGIRAAAGAYRAGWFLRFMGLERHPAYRAGGRLDYYLGDPPLSTGAVRALRALVVAAAEQVERFDRTHVEPGGRGAWPAVAAATLACTALEELAAPDGHARLAERARRVRRLLDAPRAARATAPA